MGVKAEKAVVVDVLTCPVCRSEVSTRSAGCRSCHLPLKDVAKNQAVARPRRGRAIRTRLWGVAIYGGILAWCLLQLPTAATFVIPAVAAGLILHVVRGKPIVAALAFIAIVVIAPALFWPSMLTDAMDEVGSFF